MIKNLLKWFWEKFIKQVWFAVITQFVFILIFFGVKKVGKLFPKKWKINTLSIRQFAKNVQLYFDAVPAPGDGIFDSFYKASAIYAELESNEKQTNENVLRKFVAENVLEEIEILESEFITEVLFPIIRKYSEKEYFHFFDESSYGIYKYSFELLDGRKVNLYGMESEEKEKIYKTFYITKDVKLIDLANIVKKDLGNFIEISFGITHTPHAPNAHVESDELILTKFKEPYGNNLFIKDKSLEEKTLRDIKKHREFGNQRSYMFLGAPGTGKTTFCYNLAKRISENDEIVFKATSELFDRAPNYMDTLVECFAPTVIIIDDIDRSIMGRQDEALLAFLERLKNLVSKPTFLSTANDISAIGEAFLRPGRFDEIVHFPRPNLEERKEFFKNYSKLLEIKLVPKDIEILSIETEDMTQAYLRDYCYMIKVEEGKLDRVLEQIRLRRQILNGELEGTAEPEEDEINN